MGGKQHWFISNWRSRWHIQCSPPPALFVRKKPAHLHTHRLRIVTAAFLSSSSSPPLQRFRFMNLQYHRKSCLQGESLGFFIHHRDPRLTLQSSTLAPGSAYPNETPCFISFFSALTRNNSKAWKDHLYIVLSFCVWSKYIKHHPGFFGFIRKLI